MLDERTVPIDVLVAARQPRRIGVRVHRVSWLPDAHRRSWHGIPVTSPARTLLDAGTSLSVAEHELAVASALRRSLVTLEQLRALAGTRRPGSLALAAQIDRTGGPQFTRSRAERMLLHLIREARLPLPVANAKVFGEERDLVWHEQQVVVEFDGYGFHCSPEAKANEARRDGDLTIRGWRTLRVSWRDLTETPTALVARLAATLAVSPLLRINA